ncbi:MAG: carbohydrate kinase family protein [Candidatus Moranbacteria bacterium]|nr:carbohydrate kinase family protein [Candidatus Moranbacteria bacterium]
MKYDLVAIGSAVKDIFLVTDRGKIFKTPKDKLAPEWLGFELGEKICVSEEYECLGGVAASVAIGTTKLNLKTGIVSTLVANYDWIAGELKKHRIDTKYLAKHIPQLLSLSVIIVDKYTSERVILYNQSSGKIDIDLLKMPKAEYYCVSSLTGKWAKNVLKIVDFLKKNKAKLIILPSTNQIREGFNDLKKLLGAAEILILNRNEAVEIASHLKIKDFGMKNLFKVLHDLGPKTICITDGTKGAWSSDGKQILHSPIIKVKAVDSTGAGDAFASGFLGFYLKGATLEASLKAGVINSASVVKYVGTMKGLLTKKEILGDPNLSQY